MDDIDIPTLERYRMLFKTDHPDHVWNNLSHKEFLIQLGGYLMNRREKTEGLTMAGVLKVEKLDNAFILSNPGLLKLPLEQIYAGGESRARNQRMQTMLRMIGYGENIGSGFPLILSAWNKKPELIEQPELMQVKLIIHINVAKDVAKDVAKELTNRQRAIINLMKYSPSITTEEMSQRLSVTQRTIQRDIQTLQKLGIVSREGGRFDGLWVIQIL